MRTILAVVVALAVAGASASAATITYTDSVPTQLTVYTETVTLPKFDPSLGVLTKVLYALRAPVFGDIRFENLGGLPELTITDLTVSVRLQRPDTSDLLLAATGFHSEDNVTAFDGVLDFGGTSGRSYLGLADTAYAAGDTTALADLVLFTGPGNIDLLVEAASASHVEGGGNMVTYSAASAGADVSVTYEYSPIPEPATLLLLAGGSCGVLLRRRKCGN